MLELILGTPELAVMPACLKAMEVALKVYPIVLQVPEVYIRVLNDTKSNTEIVDLICRLVPLLKGCDILIDALVNRVKTRVPRASVLIALASVSEGTENLDIDSLIGLTRHRDKGIKIGAVSLILAVSKSHLTDKKTLLPALVPMLDDSDKEYDYLVFKALANVCRDSPELAAEVGVIDKVCEYLTNSCKMQSLVGEELILLTVFALHCDEYRLKIANDIGQALHTFIDTDLFSQRVCTAGCHLIRTLSYSDKLLKEKVTITPKIISHLEKILLFNVRNTSNSNPEQIKQLTDKHNELKTSAMAVIINIIHILPRHIAEPFMPPIIDGMMSTHEPLRYNSIWALKHIIMSYSLDVQSSLVNGALVAICLHDSNMDIRSQALGCIRNLATLPIPPMPSITTLISVFLALGDSSAVTTVYTISNLSVHLEFAEAFSKSQELMNLISSYISHHEEPVRLGVCWGIYNMIFDRPKVLHELEIRGVREALTIAVHESNAEISEKKKEILRLFNEQR